MSTPILLSEKGSTRATAYRFSNKAITLDGKTHVVWLDAVAWVRGKTYDHTTNTWSETYTIGEGCDNHTTPTLTVDRDKHLRIAFGPHGRWGNWNMGCFKWLRTAKPNDISAWEQEESFGYNATYACMLHTHAGLDAIVYRGGESPAGMIFQRQRENGGWTTARELTAIDISPQYTHMGAYLTCDSNDRLYAACHLYYGAFDGISGSRGLVILQSDDLGQTWCSLDGTPQTLPAYYNDKIAIPPLGTALRVEDDIRLAGLLVDTNDNIWTLSCGVSCSTRILLLSTWKDGAWHSRDLSDALPQNRNPLHATMTIDTQGRFHIACHAVDETVLGDEKSWGHPSLEVFHLVSTGLDGAVTCRQVSHTNPDTANWLPCISLPNIHAPVERPVILYTCGVPGDGCSPTDETEVYCVFCED